MALKNPDQIAKIIVAFFDGRRLKGYSFNFSALKDSFDLFPEEAPLQYPAKVAMEDAKAVFFVKDFAGNPGYEESLVEAHRPNVEITFVDDEKVVGVAQEYDPQKLGFFLIPRDPNSNNICIFVVNRGVLEINPI